MNTELFYIHLYKLSLLHLLGSQNMFLLCGLEMATIWLGREAASTGRLNGQLKPKKSQNHGCNRLLVSLFLSVPVGLYLPLTNLVFFLEKHQAFQELRSLVYRLQGKASSVRAHEGGSMG